MIAKEERYRGSKRYLLALSEIVAAARLGRTLTYGDLAEVTAFPRTGTNMGVELGHLLGEICEDEHKQGRPLLSAIVVTQKGVPGPGFFKLARHLGRLSGSSPEAEAAFWMAERDAVHKTWATAV
jgi:hypothetical protein